MSVNAQLFPGLLPAAVLRLNAIFSGLIAWPRNVCAYIQSVCLE